MSLIDTSLLLINDELIPTESIDKGPETNRRIIRGIMPASIKTPKPADTSNNWEDYRERAVLKHLVSYPSSSKQIYLGRVPTDFADALN